MNEISMPALMLLMSASGDISRERSRRMKSQDEMTGLDDGDYMVNPFAVGNDGFVADLRDKDK